MVISHYIRKELPCPEVAYVARDSNSGRGLLPSCPVYMAFQEHLVSRCVIEDAGEDGLSLVQSSKADLISLICNISQQLNLIAVLSTDQCFSFSVKFSNCSVQHPAKFKNLTLPLKLISYKDTPCSTILRPEKQPDADVAKSSYQFC